LNVSVERGLVQQGVQCRRVVTALGGRERSRVGQVEADTEVLGRLEPVGHGPVGFHHGVQHRVDVEAGRQPCPAGHGEQRRIERVSQRDVGDPLAGQRLDLVAEDHRQRLAARPHRRHGRGVCQVRADRGQVPGRRQRHEYRPLHVGEDRRRLGFGQGAASMWSGRGDASPRGRDSRDVGEKLGPGGRGEAVHVVVHHRLEVLTAELPVPHGRQRQPALHVRGRDNRLLLGGRQRPGVTTGPCGQQFGWLTRLP